MNRESLCGRRDALTARSGWPGRLPDLGRRSCCCCFRRVRCHGLQKSSHLRRRLCRLRWATCGRRRRASRSSRSRGSRRLAMAPCLCTRRVQQFLDVRVRGIKVHSTISSNTLRKEVLQRVELVDAVEVGGGEVVLSELDNLRAPDRSKSSYTRMPSREVEVNIFAGVHLGRRRFDP